MLFRNVLPKIFAATVPPQGVISVKNIDSNGKDLSFTKSFSNITDLRRSLCNV